MKAKILNKILLSFCLMFVLGRAMTHAEDDSPTEPSGDCGDAHTYCDSERYRSVYHGS